jgi:hypothetical protein
MKKIVSLVLVLISYFGFGQTEKLFPTPMETITFNGDTFIGFDGFKNCLYIKDNVLYKKSDNALLQYQNVLLGKITKVDLLNPLKVIVFYEEFNTVIILDNQFNEIQKVEFSKLETPIVASAIGISGQNKLWVFNSLNQQIGLYDLNSNIYNNLGLPIKNGIAYYQTDFNYFQWIDKQNNWNTCTIYGRIFTNGRMEPSAHKQLLDKNKVLFSNDNTLFIRDRNLNKLYEIEIIEKSFKNFYYKDQILSIFTSNEITNYKITIP